MLLKGVVNFHPQKEENKETIVYHFHIRSDFFPKFLSWRKQFGDTEYGVNSFEHRVRWKINENHNFRAVNHFKEVFDQKKCERY